MSDPLIVVHCRVCGVVEAHRGPTAEQVTAALAERHAKRVGHDTHTKRLGVSPEPVSGDAPRGDER